MNFEDLESISSDEMSAEEVARALRVLGWSLSKAADQMGSAPAHISRARNGKGLRGAQAKLIRLYLHAWREDMDAADAIDAIVAELDALGFDYTVGDEGMMVRIPGYGRVYWDDQPGVEPGLVAEGLDGSGDPVELDEVLEELRSV